VDTNTLIQGICIPLPKSEQHSFILYCRLLNIIHFSLASSLSIQDQFFTAFTEPIPASSLPLKFTYPFDYKPHPISLLAVEKLQAYLLNQQDWVHNFGLIPDEAGEVIGKMFGVLVVQTEQGALGYLSAFSGKLAGGNHHAKFVPPIFDGLADGGFLNEGMVALTRMNEQIKIFEEQQPEGYKEQIHLLKEARKNHSNALQKELFDQYQFLNQAGDMKGLSEIFENAFYKNPPAGAGECAAPKLLQYAFQHNMKPVAMAEFWWGLSPKSDFWKHRQYYPACHEKCRPILAHMLTDIEMDEAPVPV
jgi:tRNA pseudouridine32 synthase/23S rRNA pseudouridine746 synthase